MCIRDRYALADCNNFFVSCERVFRPDLNGKPVIVLSNNDGCAVARSNCLLYTSRNDYHNYLRRERNKGMNRVNSILSRNREIIRSLLSKGIESIDTRELSMLAFDFTHFTSMDKRILGRTCYHIYEYCYYYRCV